MLFLIYFVETRVFNIPSGKRGDLISDVERDRTLDALQFNARRVLTRIAARKSLLEGEIHLVVEQSEMGRVPVLTLVSVQQATPKPQVLDLDPAERELIETGLFDDTISEARLHKVSLRERKNLRSVMLDVREVSAHARMTALMESTATERSVEQVVS